MKGFSRTIVVCLAVAIFVAGQASVSAAARRHSHVTKPEATPPPQAPPPYTLAEAEDCLKEVLPVVEQIMGRKLQLVPPCRMAEEPSHGGWASNQTMESYLALMPQLTSGDWMEIQDIMSEGGAGGSVAAYDYQDHVVWLTPNALDDVLDSGRLKRANCKAYLKLFLAHELTHAVEDQEMDFLNMRAKLSPTPDASWAYTSTVEGCAEFVEGKAAEAMHLEAIEQELLNCGKKQHDESRRYKRAPLILFDALRAAQDHIYFSGQEFIAWHYEHGGIEQVWKVLHAPPGDTSMIFHPEKYTQTEAIIPHYERSLFWLAQELGDAWHVERNMPVGEMLLRSAYVSLGDDARKKAVDNLEHVHALIITNKSSMATITLFILKDPSETADFIESLKKLEQGNFAKMNTRRIIIAGSKSLSGITGCSYSTKICYTYKIGTSSVDYLCTRIARDRVVLELNVQDQYPDDKRIITIANTVFSRLEKMGTLPVDKSGEKPTASAAK